MTKTRLIASIILFNCYSLSYAGNCLTETCNIGDRVKTHIPKDDSYTTYFCPTEALSEYTTFIFGTWAMQAALGLKPNFDIETTATGETAARISYLQRAANVSSLNEALSHCTLGKSGVKGLIVEKSKDLITTKIQPSSGVPSFWMGKGFLQKINNRN